MNVIERIQELAEKRGWSEYRLAKETNLPASTVANIYHRNTVPGIATLEAICKAFGITLCQFFADGATVALTPEQETLLDKWSFLSASQRDALLHLMDEMI